MIILGLTGSIGTGKSFTAEQFARLGAAVFDADAEVHYMLSKGGEAVPKVKKLFPDVIKNGAVDRKKLSDLVFRSKQKLTALENIIHPLVKEREEEFLKAALRHRKVLAILDIPLLFETGTDAMCDVTAVVTAPYFIQKKRVLEREGLTEAKFKKINAAQLPLFEKRKRADYVIHTGLGKYSAIKQVKTIFSQLTGKDCR